MSIKETFEKIKGLIAPFYTIILLLIVASIFFALGRLSALEERHTPIQITYPAQNQGAAAVESQTSLPVPSVDSANDNTITPPDTSASGEVIGVRSSKKYYWPWCGTLKRTKPENQIHLASIEIAKAAGFTPGGNCKGLK